ncbi:MAG: PH domain-containing protein [Nitrospirota bacterium]
MNDTDEKTIYRERPSWLNYYVLYIMGFIISGITLKAGEIGGGLIILLITGLLAAIFRFRYLFIVTNDRIMVRVGLIARNTTEMRIRHIRTMMAKQNIVERLLGIGTLITISAAEGEAAVVFKGIRDPQGVNEKIRGVCG